MQFLYYKRRNKWLKTVVFLPSCGVLERSNSPFIESIVEHYVSKNQKEIFARWVWLGGKSWKRVRQWKKVSMSSRKRNLCTCVLERKKFEITLIILKYIRNVNLSYSKMILKLQNFYQNILFLTLETVLKMAKETNKGHVESICTRVTKPASKKVVNADVYLNWLWTLD